MPPRLRHPYPAALAAFLTTLVVSGVAWGAGTSDAFTEALARGPLYAGLAAFGGGLLTSLTPCVYPMITVTVTVFGARQSKNRLQAMLLSTVFVLGIAAMFTPLGVAAGLTGTLFGSALQSTWVLVLISLVFVALAGSMFGLFEFVLPSRLTNKLATIGGIGYLGAFLLGLVSGVVAAPCTGPVLTGILLWIGQSQRPVLGGLVLFAFSLGLGVPFWLVGAFALSLPKSGKWMMGVKSVFGIALIATALYYLNHAFPEVTRIVPASSWFAWVAMALVAAGIAVGAVHLTFEEGKRKAVRKAVGIVLAVIGTASLVTWIEIPKAEAELAWMHEEMPALQIAREAGKPVLIDFTAEWCSACQRLARDTFTHDAVRQELDRFVLLKIDATHDDDPAVMDLQQRYGVAGLPTVIVIDSSGKEQVRFTDFVEAGEFRAAIRAVR